MTSSKQVLLHFGHLGGSLTSANITYMRHLWQPTNSIEVTASGLLEPRWPADESSNDTHEFVGDIVIDLVGEPTCGTWFTLVGGDKFNFKSILEPFPFLLLIFPVLRLRKWRNFCGRERYGGGTTKMNNLSSFTCLWCYSWWFFGLVKGHII